MYRKFSIVIALLFSIASGSASCNQYPTDWFQKASAGTFRAYGEYLYWKAKQEEMPYAAVVPDGVAQAGATLEAIDQGVRAEGPAPFQDEAFLAISENFRIVEPHGEYNSGFRLGLGYDLPCSNWNFDFTWTRFHEKVSSKVTNSHFGIIPLTAPFSSLFGFIGRDPTQFGAANEAKSHWTFDYDVLDFLIGRTCCLPYCAQIQPFVGVKAVQIDQKQHNHYLGISVGDLPLQVSNNKRNDFRGIGPSLGFNASWQFYPCWTLSSGMSGALLYGNFHVKSLTSISQGPNFIKLHVHNSKNCRLRPTVDANIGIDWNTWICDKYELVLGVTYEVQYWWNQWQAAASVENAILGGGVSPKGDLALYGLTIHGGISF